MEEAVHVWCPLAPKASLMRLSEPLAQLPSILLGDGRTSYPCRLPQHHYAAICSYYPSGEKPQEKWIDADRSNQVQAWSIDSTALGVDHRANMITDHCPYCCRPNRDRLHGHRLPCHYQVCWSSSNTVSPLCMRGAWLLLQTARPLLFMRQCATGFWPNAEISR